MTPGVFDADRHAKTVLKKRVRGVRPIVRALEAEAKPQAAAIRGHRAAVSGALTDNGRPPLWAAGLRLKERLV